MNRFIVFLSIALLVNGCSSPYLAGTDTKSGTTAAPAITASPDAGPEVIDAKVELIKGKSLDKIGYLCKTPLDIEIEKDIFLDMWSSTGDNYSEQRVNELVGEDTYTLISVFFYGPHSLGSEVLSFMCLQAFSTTDVNEKNSIKIGEDIYTFEDLQPYLVFKTDDICVYDVYNLTGGNDLQTQIKEQVYFQNEMVRKAVNTTAEEKKKYNIFMTAEDYVAYEDYNYLHDIAEYYKTNMDNLIVQK